MLASLAAAKASQGQGYRYPLTMRFVRCDQAQSERPMRPASLWAFLDR
jgi:hypothetical protein